VYALVVDSSTPAVTAAVVELDADRVIVRAERTTVDAKAHGELLAPEVHDALADAGIGPRELAAVVAGVGPGPFTGLRVGLVTAAALGQTLAIPTYGVCSLDGLGFGQGGTVLVATDARRREVYWAVYRDGVRLTGPAVDKPDAVPVDADYAVGEGAARYASLLDLPVREEPRYPSALALATLAADRVLAGKPTEPLTPLYLRRPDAAEPKAGKPVSR
jgi:tRNA threonylcarbamoyl adenosine modification protein YeaZ